MIVAAYGKSEDTQHQDDKVIKTAAQHAEQMGEGLRVVHVANADEAEQDIHEHIRNVVSSISVDVDVTVDIVRHGGNGDVNNISQRKRLTNTLGAYDDVTYVVMGDVKRTGIGELTHSSMTEAVLNTHTHKILLVPL